MKKINRFTEIKTLYSRLSLPERELLLLQLNSIEQYGVRGFEKTPQLLTAIQQNPSIGREDALKEIGWTSKKFTDINNNLLLLKEYMLEHMQGALNLERPGVYSNQFRIRASNSKKIQQARILLARNMRNQGVKVLEEVVSRSEKYEIFNHTVEAYKLLQFIHGVDKGIRTFKRYDGYIAEARKKQEVIDLAERIYAEFRMHEGRGKEAPLQSTIIHDIDELEKLNKSFNLGYPTYIVLIIRIELLLAASELRKCETACVKMIALIQNFPSVQSEERETFVAMQLAVVRMRLHKFELAKEALNHAQALLKKSSYESYLCTKYHTLIDFHQNLDENLTTALPRIIKSKYTLRMPHAAAQFQYYAAVLDFKQAAYKNSAKILLAELDLSETMTSDASLGLNVLLFMNGIELQDTDPPLSLSCMEKAIENLDGISDSVDLRKRDKVILKIIKRLHTLKLDFHRTESVVKDNLLKLEDKDPDYQWDPISYEVIPFAAWFKGKLQIKSGKPNRLVKSHAE